MKLSCIAIDDEPLALEVIKKYAYKNDQLLLQQVFDNVIEAEKYLQQHTTDLLFVDIDMPDKSGIELIAGLSKKPLIIFTTAHKKFALQAFDMEAVDYLLKPIQSERFDKAVEKAIVIAKGISKAEDNDSFLVYAEYKLVKIVFSNVLYIESMQDYVKIHLQNEKPVMTLQTLKKVLELLPAEKFQQVHRSYIVAVDKIKSLQQKNIELINGTQLPVSNSYSSFIKAYKEKLRN
ncbi:LytR/AlgR family response regulator transcription factor [Ferruginibacter sp. SUN106]|uniref:LytR/AlgR family response regulator transcription factor n=1 Tax=Ferruginibacter sp. SUN106 TaxID=2978348 RepID=UPI003D3683CB